MGVRKLIIVVGKVCSGKDFVADNVFDNALKIDIGSIVRSLTKTTQRIHQKTLDIQIIVQVHKAINATDKDVVITGIRQLTIYNNLLLLASGRRFKQVTYYLECPLEVLRERYYKRNNPKDMGIPFEDVIEKDAALGLAELEQVVLNEPNTITININETDAVQKIKEWKGTGVDH